MLGGVHIELTGEDVTECIGGARGLAEADLARAYRIAGGPAAERRTGAGTGHADSAPRRCRPAAGKPAARGLDSINKLLGNKVINNQLVIVLLSNYYLVPGLRFWKNRFACSRLQVLFCLAKPFPPAVKWSAVSVRPSRRPT